MAPGRDPVTGRFTSGGGSSIGSTGGASLGGATGYIRIDASSVGTAISGATQSLNNFFTSTGSRMQAFGQQMAGAGLGLLGITAPIVAVGRVGLDTAADFDVLLKQIELFGGVAPEQMETVRQFAMQMGQDTKFSNNEAAAAMLDLLKSGMSLEEAMAALRPVLDAATVGNLGLAEAAGFVSSGLAQFNLDATEAARVSNAMAAAANVSRAEIRDIGQAMQNVGPVAAQYGLEVEDVAGILAVFADNGIMGAEAGTQLKSMLLNLSRPTDSVKGAFERLGVSMYNSDGSLRNFNTVLLELDAALDRLPMEEQNELAQTLAGSYGIMGLQAPRAAGGIDATLTAMQDAPAAASLAEQFMNTFRGSMESLTGSGETFLTEFLTPFMNDVAGPFVRRLTEIINGLTDWARANPQLTKTIATVVLAVAGLGAGMAAIGGVLSGAGTVIGFIGTALGALMSPIGLVVAAIAGLGLAFSTNFLGIRDLFEPIIQNIIDGFTFAVEAVSIFIDDIQSIGIVDAIRKAFGIDGSESWVEGVIASFLGAGGQATGAMRELAINITSFLGSAVEFVLNTVIPGMQAFGTLLGDIWTAVQPGLSQMADWFLNTALPGIANFIQTIVIPGVQAFINLLIGIWNAVAPGLGELITWFTETLAVGVVNLVNNVIIPGVQGFIDLLAGIWTTVQPVLEDLYNWFMTDGLPAIKDFIEQTVVPGIQAFVDILEGIWVVVQPALQDLYNWFMTDGLPAIRDFISTVKTSYIDPFITTLQNIWTSISPGLNDVVNWFRDTFQHIGTNYIQPVIDTVGNIITKVQDALNWLRQLGGGAPNPNLIDQNSAQFGFQTIPMRDSGGPGLAGMPYLIGRQQVGNEVYVPETNGTFIPNMGKMLEAIASGAGGGDTFNVTVNANDRAGGLAAAEAFEERIMQGRFARGNR